MKTTFRRILGGALTIALSTSIATAVAAPSASAQSSLSSSSVSGGGNVSGRSYHVEAPVGVQLAESPRIVIAFGGWQHTASKTQSYAKLENYFGNDTVVVYAEATTSGNQNNKPAWGGAPYATGTSIKADTNYVRKVVAEVSAEYNLSNPKVIAAGLSNGGGMALALGCHASDLVDGVIGVAGAYYDPTVTNCDSGQVPTIIMHGTDDETMDYNGGTLHDAPYKSVNQVFNTFASKNNCGSTSTETNPGNGTTVISRDGCASTTQIVRVNGGAHTWFPNGLASRQVKSFADSV